MSEIVPYQHYQEIVSYGRSPEVMETFSRLVGRNAPHYVQSAIIAVQANDRLMQCTPRSIFRSALRAATLRLTCDPALGHAWLVPYKNKNGGLEAQFQAGWKGIQHMAIRTGKYRYINVAPVYEGEEIVEDRITGSLRIEGGVTSPKKEKGLIASFALLSGLQKSIYMTNEEMDEHGKRYSKGYNKTDGIWMTNRPAAYHKTILLKLLRTYGYLDPSDAAILDDEQPEVNDLELPDETDVTIVESKPITAAEANKILGFDGADVDQDGNVVTVIVEKPGILTQAAASTKAAETITDGEVSVEITQEKQVVDEIVEAQKVIKNKWARPMPPDVLKEALQLKVAKTKPASEKQTNLVRMLLLEHFADRDDERHQAQEFLTGHKSFKDIEPEMISAMLDWMKPVQSNDGSGAYVLDKNAKVELSMVSSRFMENIGQETLDY